MGIKSLDEQRVKYGFLGVSLDIKAEIIEEPGRNIVRIKLTIVDQPYSFWNTPGREGQRFVARNGFRLISAGTPEISISGDHPSTEYTLFLMGRATYVGNETTSYAMPRVTAEDYLNKLISAVHEFNLIHSRPRKVDKSFFD